MLKSILKKIIVTSLCWVSIAHSMEEKEFLTHANEYIKFIGITDYKIEAKNAKEAFLGIGLALEKSRKAFINKGEQFGRSFTTKNNPPLGYIHTLLTGSRKGWAKEKITTIGPKIADIGCGLGVSTVDFILKLGFFYERNKWSFIKPIEVDLYDINPLHQEGLAHLSSLINLAYPQYFKVTSFTHDIQKELIVKNHYHIMLAFSLVHYVPSSSWKSIFTNMASAMKKNGILFLLSDDFGPVKGLTQLRQVSEKDPFFCPYFLLANKNYPLSTATKVMNIEGIKILKNNEVHIPNASYCEKDLNIINVETIIRVNAAVENVKEIPLYTGGQVRELFTIEDVMMKLKEGDLSVHCANYSFSPTSLETAIFSTLGEDGPFKKISLTWTDSVSQDFNSGITLMKK